MPLKCDLNPSSCISPHNATIPGITFPTVIAHLPPISIPTWAPFALRLCRSLLFLCFPFTPIHFFWGSYSDFPPFFFLPAFPRLTLSLLLFYLLPFSFRFPQTSIFTLFLVLVDRFFSSLHAFSHPLTYAFPLLSHSRGFDPVFGCSLSVQCAVFFCCFDCGCRYSIVDLLIGRRPPTGNIGTGGGQVVFTVGVKAVEEVGAADPLCVSCAAARRTGLDAKNGGKMKK
ncbi:hypothetical protein DFJ73DRAFT_21061 [Zopfochytrium polystomum]|nr:hypothetical protein DFJ73DRAFT_21061 [Zopfochytrium polystomum]